MAPGSEADVRVVDGVHTDTLSPRRPPTPSCRRYPHGVRRAAVTILVVALVALVAFSGLGCSRSGSSADGEVTLLVTQKVLPIGKLVQAAVDDGSIVTTRVPADVAPTDRVGSSDEIRCLVPSQNVPAGTLLRRSMFVEPAQLGLDKGLTDQTAKPTVCG